MALARWASWDDAGDGCRSPIAAVGRNGEATVVALAGELDIATQETLTQTLAKAIALDDADLVVDLSRVAYIDVATYWRSLAGPGVPSAAIAGSGGTGAVGLGPAGLRNVWHTLI